MKPEQAEQELHDRIIAGLAKKTRDQYRLDPVRQLLSQITGKSFDVIVAAWVRDNAQTKRALDQSSGRAALTIAIVGSEVDQIVSAARRRYVGPGRQTPALAVVEKGDDGHWRLERVVERDGGEMWPLLRDAFPDARRVVPEGITAQFEPLPPVQMPLPPKVTSHLIVDDRTRTMIRRAIAAHSAVLLVGPPGTGKTSLLREVIDEAFADPASYGLVAAPAGVDWHTPEESWTARDLAGGPTVDPNGELRFRPGYVLDALRANHWLVLDETNRADMDRIFGGLLTWLSGQDVTLGRATEEVDAAAVVLAWHDKATSDGSALSRLEDDDVGTDPIRVTAGRDWRMLGTYNATDAQRVFRIGQALGRRFVRVPIPPLDEDGFRLALEQRDDDLPTWARKAVGDLYAIHSAAGMVLGPAILLRCADYLVVALASNVDLEEEDDDSSASRRSEMLAEGYLLAAGPWLARAEEELDLVRQAVVEDLKLLREDDWKWLTALLPSLA